MANHDKLHALSTALLALAVLALCGAGVGVGWLVWWVMQSVL